MVEPKAIRKLKEEGRKTELRIAYAFLETINEVSKKHPALENYKDELLQTFIEHLNEGLVEKYSCLPDDELKERAKKVLETAIENTVLETVLNRLNYISKKIEKIEKDMENDHKILANDHKILAEGLNGIAKIVGNHGRYIEGQLEEVKRDVNEVKGKIDEAKEEISKEISDIMYYLSR